MDKRKLLVVVDMQNDFIDGHLGTEEAMAIVDKVCQKIDSWDGYVAFTFDTHYDDYLETVEGRHIPFEHCINETPGWRLHPRIEERRTGKTFSVYKDSFGATTLIDLVRTLEIKEIQLVGLCTDICVISNALLLRSAFADAEISVDAECCAASSPFFQGEALDIMRCCCIDILNE